MPKLYVIAGHGAGDSGASGNGYTEAERVRALANRMKALGGDNVVVLDTSRNWYEDAKSGGGIWKLNLPKGSEILELHMDSGVASAKGGHVLDKPGIPFDDGDRAVASFISSFMPGRSESLRHQGLANASAANSKGYGYRLVECGFITNAGDIAKFNNQMDELANGLLACFGINGSIPITTSKENDLKAINIPSGTYDVYRLYNKNTGRHLFTSNGGERSVLIKAGWNDEGVAFKGHDTGVIVYRMYNPNKGEHMFTAAFAEADALARAGWTYEGANFAAARSGIPVYRLYNPNSSDHMFTTSAAERDNLVRAGWKSEGVAWYAVKE